MTSAPDDVRAQLLAGLRTALEAEEARPARQTDVKDVARAQRITDGFEIEEDYEHLLRLRDSHDPRWHQAGAHAQLAASMYEQQKSAATGSA